MSAQIITGYLHLLCVSELLLVVVVSFNALLIRFKTDLEVFISPQHRLVFYLHRACWTDCRVDVDIL
jgi:hypothetical protein